MLKSCWRSDCAIGTGKSLTATELCSRTGMRHVDVGLVAKQQDLYDGFDDQYQCPILDEEKVGCVASLPSHVSVFRWWMSWRR